MRMHKFGFLSSAPQSFIFQRNSNKTNFGGVCSLIYLIVVLIIAAFYLIFYFIEDNYSIEYLYYEKILTEEENTEKKSNPKYNPKFEFHIGLYEGNIINRKKVEDRFILKDWKDRNWTIVEKYDNCEKNITEVDWLILYD